MENIVFQTQRKRKKKRILAGMILLFLFLLSSILVYLYPFDSRKAEAYFHGENPILFNGKQAGNGLIAGDMAYVPLAFMQDYIDDSILFDKKSDSIIIITENHVVQFPTNSLTYYVNQVPVQLGAPPLILENGERYLALDPVLSYYGIDYMLLHETGAIKIIENGMKLTIGTINGHDVDEKRLRLRTKPDLQSPYTAQTVDNEKVTIENELDKYYYIRKENGIAGYLEKNMCTRRKQKPFLLKKNKRQQICRH